MAFYLFVHDNSPGLSLDLCGALSDGVRHLLWRSAAGDGRQLPIDEAGGAAGEISIRKWNCLKAYEAPSSLDRLQVGQIVESDRQVAENREIGRADHLHMAGVGHIVNRTEGRDGNVIDAQDIGSGAVCIARRREGRQ